MSNQTLQQLAVEHNLDIPTLERFMKQVAMDLAKVDMSGMHEDQVTSLISDTIDTRHTRNLEVINDCIAHPAETAALVFSLL